ncbi:MAG: ribulose-phosphate 3-epimerase [Candidatus Omnitrophota bacterium]|jgi:ribulose-phosphate 3-epimerase
MKKIIVPAILTEDKQELVRMCALCAGFCSSVQIDIMDGKFVPSKSVTVDDLADLRLSMESEAHLMVEDPLEWLEVFKKIGSKRIIFHFEIKKDHEKIINELKNAGLEAGIAINPSTKISTFSHLLDKVESVLFMSVVPGFYGSKFIPEVLEKIQKFKKIYPQKCTGIDGGVKPDNIARVVRSGVDYICVGSAVLKAEDPKAAYLAMEKNI